MLNGNEKRKVLFFIGLPTFLFYFLTVVVLIAVPEHHDMLVVLALMTFIFLFILVIQAYIIKKKILTRIVAMSELERLIKAQEHGARMLVRRDLELTRANERLQKLDEVKSNFISVVAHQLRTPLSGIKWTLNLLTSEDLGALKTEQKTFLMKAYESNERMISLVNDLLGADRVESGKLRYQFQPVPIGDVVDSVLFELIPQAKLKHITIKFVERAENLPKIRADAEKLRAVMQNLLDNAIKYSRDGGQVDIGFRPSGKEMLVFIKDDGIGIPKSEQIRVFERFFRAQNAIKTEVGGTGLGLYIVKSMIEQQGGKVWFESEEGKGVTFSITLPIVEEGIGNMDAVAINGV